MKTLQMAPSTTLKHRVARLGFGVSLAAMLALGAAMPALADESPDGTLNLTAGSRTVDAANFAFENGGAPGVVLTGVLQTATASPAITVTNATGDDLGWKISLSSTAFQDTTPVTPKTLAANARIIAVPTISGGALDTGDNTTSYTTARAVTAANEIALVAQTADGNGVFTLTPTITIDIPANTTIPAGGSYTSTFTIDIVAAP